MNVVLIVFIIIAYIVQVIYLWDSLFDTYIDPDDIGNTRDNVIKGKTYSKLKFWLLHIPFIPIFIPIIKGLIYIMKVFRNEYKKKVGLNELNIKRN